MAEITEDQRHIHSGGYWLTACSMSRHYSPSLPTASQSGASRGSKGIRTSPAPSDEEQCEAGGWQMLGHWYHLLYPQGQPNLAFEFLAVLLFQVRRGLPSCGRKKYSEPPQAGVQSLPLSPSLHRPPTLRSISLVSRHLCPSGPRGQGLNLLATVHPPSHGWEVPPGG